jgi:hypothetical protein
MPQERIISKVLSFRRRRAAFNLVRAGWQLHSVLNMRFCYLVTVIVLGVFEMKTDMKVSQILQRSA